MMTLTTPRLPFSIFLCSRAPLCVFVCSATCHSLHFSDKNSFCFVLSSDFLSKKKMLKHTSNGTDIQLFHQTEKAHGKISKITVGHSLYRSPQAMERKRNVSRPGLHFCVTTNAEETPSRKFSTQNTVTFKFQVSRKNTYYYLSISSNKLYHFVRPTPSVLFFLILLN